MAQAGVGSAADYLNLNMNFLVRNDAEYSGRFMFKLKCRFK
jgi:hypothetical protein